MIEINPEVGQAVNSALEIAQRGEIQNALTRLTGLLHDHPRNHGVAFGIGAIYAIKREHKNAIKWFDKAIAINPFSEESHYNRAVAYQKLLDVPNTIRAFQKVVEIGQRGSAELARARGFLADMAAVIKKTEGVSLNVYLRAGDKFNEAHDLMQVGNWDGALKGFRASSALNGRSAACHGNMGICHGRLGHKAEALAALDRALEIDPEYQPALLNYPLVEQMEEGQPLEGPGQSINYPL